MVMRRLAGTARIPVVLMMIMLNAAPLRMTGRAGRVRAKRHHDCGDPLQGQPCNHEAQDQATEQHSR